MYHFIVICFTVCLRITSNCFFFICLNNILFIRSVMWLLYTLYTMLNLVLCVKRVWHARFKAFLHMQIHHIIHHHSSYAFRISSGFILCKSKWFHFSFVTLWKTRHLCNLQINQLTSYRKQKLFIRDQTQYISKVIFTILVLFCHKTRCKSFCFMLYRRDRKQEKRNSNSSKT